MHTTELMQLQTHKKKMTAPVIIAVIMVLYYMLFFAFLLMQLEGVWKLIFGILPLGMSGGIIMVLRERIREIKEGEEDDLGQY